MANNRTQVFDKDTLLVYLINELSPNFNYKVETMLIPNGTWVGKLNIEETKQDDINDIIDYYVAIGENCKKAKEG